MGRRKCPMCDISKDTSEVIKRSNHKVMCDSCHNEISIFLASTARLAQQGTTLVQGVQNEVNDDGLPPNNCIQNELLSYLQYYLSRSSSENLKAVIVRFYGEAEINKAKLLLWRCVEDDIIGVFQNRITTASRSALEANTQDIITAFQKSDAQGVLLPSFAAIDLNRVPKFAPEEMGDFAVREKLSALEQRLNLMENQVLGNSDSIKTLEISVQQGLFDIDQDKFKNKTDTYATKQWPKLPERKSNNQSSSMSGNSGNSGNNANSKPSTPRGRMLPVLPLENTIWSLTPKPKRLATTGTKSSYPEPGVSNAETNEWQMTRQERQRIRREKRKNETVIGKREGISVKSGLKHINVFVSRVHPDETDESVKSFICDEGVEVIDIKQVSNVNAFMKSYRVTINFDDLNKVLDEGFWPKGMGCRTFYEKRT